MLPRRTIMTCKMRWLIESSESESEGCAIGRNLELLGQLGTLD